jgi:4-deoxy-L-threo-5-hexosulose-uronate ketol-isomerase
MRCQVDALYTADPVRCPQMTSEELRDSFLIADLFGADAIRMVYSDVDRAIIGSAVPVKAPLVLEAAAELRAETFCQRRELGVLNIGGPGTITVDGTEHQMASRDALYVGRGSKAVCFASAAAKDPARYYLLSYPAHAEHPTVHVKQKDAEVVRLGNAEAANERTIYKLIQPGLAESCQLVMGFTVLKPGSVWNTMPPHTHERRMEVYMYFDLPEDARVFHLMGRPGETRHIVVANGQAVVSPSWSIHCGVGTCAYTFCWGMGGENQAYDDMDHLAIDRLR